MSDAVEEKALDGFAETVHEPSKPSSLGFSAEEAAVRVARNRAARLRFAATEADKAERLKGEPVEHRPRGEIGPTAATKARLKPDVLRRLFNHGHLDRDQLLAANQIRDVFEAVVRDLLPRAGRFGLGGSGRTAFVPAIERLPVTVARSYVHAYLPWTKAFGDRWWRVREGGELVAVRRSAVEVVLDVVIDNRTIEEVAAGFGMRAAVGRSVVLAMLSQALDDYAGRAMALSKAMSADCGKNKPRLRGVV